MPRYVYRGSRGVRAIPLKARKADKKGLYLRSCFLWPNVKGRGKRKRHISTPFDMLRSRPFLKIRFTCSSAGNTRQQGASMTVRTFRLPLTLFNTFNIFPRTGQCAFPWAVGHGQQRAKRISCAFFSVASYRTAPAVRPSEECTALVETDRDFADRNPPPHSSPKHPEPFDILIGDGPLRSYQRLRLLRRRGTRKARKAVYRPSLRPIGRPRFYFVL